MGTDFPIQPPADENEFRSALHLLIKRADESGIDPETGWGFRTEANGWSIEILRLKPSENDSTNE